MKQTSLCYIENFGRYLMTYRGKKENDENKGKWIGVGGKFKEGESPEDCMLRETFEETGIRVSDFKYRGIVTFVSDIYETEHMHLFTATSDTDKFTICNEGELRWIPKEKVLSLNLWEGDKVFLKLMEDENAPFFSLKLQYEGDSLINTVINGKSMKDR
ncbi:MAG: 8-oxo-dGTP diphosphatase [Ruminococcaceae bacterium]|nr:8-oxo-dGTP diphosphatase [Oscillospiraceae bacterium]